MTTIYDVLRRPIITEKSNYLNSNLHQYMFEVTPKATKRLVKDAVETLFDVRCVDGKYHQCARQAHTPCSQPPLDDPPQWL